MQATTAMQADHVRVLLGSRIAEAISRAQSRASHLSIQGVRFVAALC